MKRRKRVSQEEQLTLGERWVSGRSYGDLFTTFKKLSADDLETVLARFTVRSHLTPTHTVVDVPEATSPKRFDAVPEIAALRREPDGEGFVRILTEVWELLEKVHPKQWRAVDVIPVAIALQGESPGAFLRVLEGVRRFWAELPTSPFFALEREQIRRFLDFLEIERNLG
jgi:hypothetical protein